MSEPFIAEIRIFPFNFAPSGWAWCDGQLLPIAQNTALFSLLGTTYGGNGQTTFALPNLAGRAVMHPGQGPGLSARVLGESGGAATVTLLSTEMPVHTHTLSSQSAPGDSPTPQDNSFARTIGATPYQPPAGSTPVAMSPTVLAPTGGGQPHNNLQPYLTFHFAIALQGIFPPRT